MTMINKFGKFLSVRICAVLAVFALCALSWFMLSVRFPLLERERNMQWLRNSTFYQVDLGPTTFKAKSVFPKGSYSLFATGHPIDPKKRNGHFAYDDYFSAFTVNPTCDVDVWDGFGVGELREATPSEDGIKFREFNAYAKLNGKVYLINDYLVFDGDRYYLSDKNVYNSIFEKIAVKCRFLP